MNFINPLTLLEIESIEVESEFWQITEALENERAASYYLYLIQNTKLNFLSLTIGNIFPK